MLHCPQEMLFCPCPGNFTQLLSISLLLLFLTLFSQCLLFPHPLHIQFVICRQS